METIYIALVGLLFLLAISDLVVGVSNDAVNFLNSAIGSKAASFKTIMFIAALGILVGATFSSGMMEIARKGIFNPQMFFFSEIMIIFVAVMITDIILLDIFNTYALPTSTTVSIVFELLGAAVAVSILKVSANHSGGNMVLDFINSGKALEIIGGILLSVVVAFTVGGIIQYITRLIFSFNYEKRFKYFGSIFGGIAITSITYFILIKGANGASFMTNETKLFINENSFLILIASFVGWTILLQVMKWLFNLNILKFIVLVGTFALAMAFAGNDLVNFIGVPLAGFASYTDFFINNPGGDPNAFLMASLQNKVQTPTLFLLTAGLIMVVTLWLSKKARGVTKTEVNLGRQGEGEERFKSSYLSRSIVRLSMAGSNLAGSIVPAVIKKYAAKQFEQKPNYNSSGKDAPAFDMLRASINLVVASILIAFATSLKLPLSTTYVTFMVAMGTSLSDKAWDRESAVYRVSGVLTIIGGWFFTAFSAFTAAFILALLFSWGGIYAITIMALLALLIIIRTHGIHKKRSAKEQEAENIEVNELNVIEKCNNNVSETLIRVNGFYKRIIQGIEEESLKKLNRVRKDVKDLNKKTKSLKDSLGKTINKFNDDDVETGHYYVQVIDYLREIAHNINYIVLPCYEHVNNNHKGLIEVQLNEIKSLREKIEKLLKGIVEIIDNEAYGKIDSIIIIQQGLIKDLEHIKKLQIKRIKHEEVGTKNSLLYFKIIDETKNLIFNAVNVLKSQRDFTLFDNYKKKH